MDNQLVSIIVPCYNGEKFVDRCINSIYIQNYSPIELVIVDDGSTDQSKTKILKWETPLREKGIELSYVYQGNTGVGGAINTGLKCAKGEYISLLDIDDEYLPDCIIERVHYLDEHPGMGCVITNGYVKNGESKYLFSDELSKINKSEVFDKLILGDFYNWAGSYMVRAKPLKEYYKFHEFYCSRNGQNLQILLPTIKNSGVGILDVPHMIYHKQPNSLSSSKTGKMEKSIKNANDYYAIRIHMIQELLSDEDKEYYITEAQYGLWRSILNIAVDSQNKKLSNEAYSALINTKLISLDDRIRYFSLNSRFNYYLFRAIRKLKNTIGKLLSKNYTN